jgi:hypothetical protein
VVLLVLALIWAGVIVLWIRSRAASGEFGDSVGMFSQHLHVLERTGPTTVVAANRMRGPSLAAQSPYRPVPRGQGAARMSGPVTTGSMRQQPMSAAALRRRQSRKRRRDVLFSLVGAAGFTLFLGVIPGMHKLLYLNLVIDLLLAGYVALLVKVRNLAAERSAKLTWLPRVQPVPSGAVRRGTGRYAHLAGGDDFASREFILSRAAN